MPRNVSPARGFRLGSVLGFEIRIDVSWFVILFLVLWSFGRGYFPGVLPELDAAYHLALGAVGTVLFFASLLAHELAHSVVARSRGIPVDGITLFLFGGMAHTRSEAERPVDELVIAGVGPLMSFALGLAFFAVGGLAGALGAPEAVGAVTGLLAVLNVALAVFNLLPGFPLDGGRLFRAVMWHATGDLTRATRWASTGGRWLGLLLIGFGFLQLFAGLGLGGLWMILIGWFLRGAADMTYRDHVLRTILDGVPARTLMSANPATVRPELAVQELVDGGFLRRRYQAFPVVDDDGRVLGLVTLAAVKELPREEWLTTSVSEVMVPADETLVVDRETSALDVLATMRESGTGRVLVVREGRLEGIVSPSDITGWALRMEELGGPGRPPTSDR